MKYPVKQDEERSHAAESRVMLASTMPRQRKGRMKSNVFMQPIAEAKKKDGRNPMFSSRARVLL